MAKIELKGLKGLAGLSDAERQKWIEENKAAGKITNASSWDKMDRLYRNQAYINKYGLQDFKSRNARERDAIWKTGIALEDAETRYNPYEARHSYAVSSPQELYKAAKEGHPIPRERDLGMVLDVREDKGVGDAKLWEQIKSMATYDPDSYFDLVNSDWKTPNELKKELETRRKLVTQSAESLQKMPVSSADAISYDLANKAMSMGADIGEDVVKEKNDKLYKDILGKSLAKRDDQTLQIQKELAANILAESGNDKDKVEEAWQALINEHIPAFAAQYNADGTLAEGNDLENLSLQEKAELLAKAEVLFQTMSYEDARERLNNVATSYIRDHQSWWERTGMHARDFSIRAGSYAAAHITGIGQLIADARGSSEVWMDNKGNIIDPIDVTGTSEDGKRGNVIDAKGNVTPVRKVPMSIKDLYYQGKDDAGRDLPGPINSKLWNDAERFNIYPWQEDKIKRARELGYSTQQILYNPGEEDSFGSFLLEAGKMGSFMLVDGIVGTFTGGIGNIGEKTARALSIGRGVVAANAIGHQYGTGVYAETYEGNMAKLEEQALEQAKTNAADTFNTLRQNNPEFEAQYQEALKIKAAELKARDPKKKATTRDGKTVFTSIHDDSYYKALAEKELIDGWVSQNIDSELENIKNSDEYFKGVEEAHESAASAAAVTAITDAAKYALVNTMGWRKFLFTTKAQRTAEHTKDILSKMQKTGTSASEATRRFEGMAPWKTAEGRKWLGKKALSNFWGGAWTNFTDEMQAAGGRQMNEDRFNAYLNGDYDAEGRLIGYNGFLSYLDGANRALGKYSTWKAGAVGGAGAFLFTPNMAGIINATMMRDGKAQLRDAFRNSGVDEWGDPKSRDWGRLIDMFFSNSILNEYQGIRSGERKVQQHINMIKKMVSDNEDFKALYDALSLDGADRDATNPEDKEVIKFLKAINSMKNVNEYAFKDPQKDKTASDLDIVAHEIDEARRAIMTIDKISKGEFTEEDATEFLSEWYAKNPSIAQSEENDRAAVQEIVQNANLLKEASETVDEVLEKLNKIEKDRGKPIDSNVKGKLIERFAVAHILDKQDLEGESRIQGREITQNTSTRDDAPIESWGTIEAINIELKGLENTDDVLEKEINKATKTRDKAKSALDKFISDHKKDKGENVFKLLPEVEKLQSTLDNAEQQLKYLNQVKSKNKNKAVNLSNRVSVLEAQRKSGQSERILSKEEILSLNPEARARMMARHNRNNYSKEQQAEIEALENELVKRDPSLLKDIETQARIAQHRRANENAYSMMVLHPDAAAIQMESEIAANAKSTLESINLRNALGIANVLNKWKMTLSKDEIKNRVFNQLKIAPIGLLKYLDKLDGSEEGLEDIAEYKEDIRRALEWAEFSKNIDNAAKQMEFADEAERAYFVRSISNVIEGTTSKEEAQKALEDAVNAEGVSDQDKTKFQTLLKNIGIEVQLKQATNTETEAQKNTREQQKQQQQQQQEQKIKAAEEKGKIEGEKKKAEEKTKDNAEVEVSDSEESGKALEETKDNNLENSVADTDVTINAELKQIADQQGTSVDNLEELPVQSLEDQVAKANSDGEVVAEVADAKPDLTDSGNKIETTPENLLGNTMYGYNLNSLIYEGIEQERIGREPNDAMNQYFNWLRNAGIKLQEIIDNELNQIIKVNPELRLVYINPQENATNDAALGNYAMLAVKYTDAVQKIHNAERGGVIETNDGKYLLVGTLGSNSKNKAQSIHFKNILDAGKSKRDTFFDANQRERFFVDPSMYTEVEKIAAGRLVRQSIGESEITIKRISELLADKKSNPKNLKLQDLKWLIQYNTKVATVNVTSRNKVHNPKDALSNSGNAFVLVEGANGEYIPAYIIPTFLKEISDGALKTELNSLFERLASADHGERLLALYGLFHWLNLGTDKNILIGTADKPTVSLVEDGITTHTFNVANSDFSILDFKNALIELNPRINLTIANLMDKVTLQMLDEAGALTLDLSRLTTSNISYTVYGIGNDGKPIKTTAVSVNQSTDVNVNSDLATATNKVENSQLFAGQVYRKRNGGWVDRVGVPVTDVRLKEQLDFNNFLEVNKLGVSLNEGQNEYYVINNDPNNPVVWSRNSKTSFVVNLSKDAARNILARINAKALQEEREKAAKAINETLSDTTAPETQEEELSDSMNEGIYVFADEDFDAQSTDTSAQTQVKTETPSQVINSEVRNDISNEGERAAYSGKTLAELQQSTQPTTAEEISDSEEFGERLFEILDDKGFVGETSEDLNEFLQEKNMPITGITNVESWLQMLKDCR